MKEILGVGGLIVVIIALIVVGPIFTIMALNTVFGLSIAINFWTWLSTLWLQGLLVSKVSK